MLISLKSGAVGLNLTAASNVFLVSSVPDCTLCRVLIASMSAQAMSSEVMAPEAYVLRGTYGVKRMGCEAYVV